MREILFRGKAQNTDEWAYGYYTELPEGDIGATLMAGTDELLCEDTAAYIISIETKQCPSFSPAYPIQVFDASSCKVRPETVGQYTGLKDKNGNKIFEGDIFVSYEYGDKKYDLIGVIERRGASFILRSENYEDSQLNDYVEGTITHYKPNGERIVLESDIVQGEVIGTIYDNPELLEVEK